MLDKMNNNSIIPPPHLLEIYSTSTASHWQKRTSLYAFASEFRRCRNSLLFNTSGIRAAVANPRRIRSGMDAAGSKLQQVFRQKNLSLYSVHGRTLYNMPAGVFYTLLASASSISKRHFRTDTDVRVHLLAGYLYRLFPKVFIFCSLPNKSKKLFLSFYFAPVIGVSKGNSLWSLFFFF